MVISIQRHILAQEIETCPEELSFAALGQVCPQHQIWANSFPKPLSAMGTMWHQCLLLQGWTLGKPKESGIKWQWGLWGHRHTGLPPWWVISTAWFSKKLEKSELANQLEKKWLRKAPPTKESSGNKWNFPGDPTPVFAQVCYLHTACNNNSHPQCTALRKNQDSSNFTHLLQEKADWHFCICFYSGQETKYMWVGSATFPDLHFHRTSCTILHFCILDKSCFKLATETRPEFGLKNFPFQKFHWCNSCCLHMTTIICTRSVIWCHAPEDHLKLLPWILPCTFFSRKEKYNILNVL